MLCPTSFAEITHTKIAKPCTPQTATCSTDADANIFLYIESSARIHAKQKTTCNHNKCELTKFQNEVA